MATLIAHRMGWNRLPAANLNLNHPARLRTRFDGPISAPSLRGADFLQADALAVAKGDTTDVAKVRSAAEFDLSADRRRGV